MFIGISDWSLFGFLFYFTFYFSVFVVATDDSHLVLVAEASKNGSDCFQQKWPVQIENLQVIGAKQLVVVSKNVSEVAVVVVEGDRIAVPK